MSAPDEGFWSNVPFGSGVRRVALDANGLVALDKPEGVLSHPNVPRDEARSLLRAHYDKGSECYEWQGAGAGLERLWLINRLDSATSGVILAAADAALAREIRAQFQRRQVRKTYQALVFGVPRKPSEEWKDVLNVTRAGGHIRTAAGGNLPAESRMSLRAHLGPRAARVADRARAAHGQEPPAPGSVREAGAADRRRPHLRKFRGEPRICEDGRAEAPVPAFALDRLRLRIWRPQERVFGRRAASTPV